MEPSEKYKITSNEYGDFLIEYNGYVASLEKYKGYTVHIMNDRYAVIYIPASEITRARVFEQSYISLPYCYSLCSRVSLNASGINRLRRIPTLNLRGNGVLIGLLDTGIDYTNPAFLRTDGTTKIVSIWDQTIDSEDQYPNMTFQAYYGTEYTAEQINLAIKSSDPVQVVPSIDELGHGTMLAGIAAGSEDEASDFSGVAPDADLIIVKLKQAKNYVRDYLSIPLDVPCYMENDLIWGIQYLVEKARQLRRPLAVCIGVGSSQGSHQGRGDFATVTSTLADFPGVVISVAAGNEGGLRRHFYSTISPTDMYKVVELNVGDNEPGFTLEFWGTPPNIYTFDIMAPSGEYIPMVRETLQEYREITFFFEETVIYLDFIMVEANTGNQAIILHFKKPSKGIWKFQVYTRGDVLQGEFHMWLPSDGFISEGTYFVQADIYTTITSPGNSLVPITTTAYDPVTEALYKNASRGNSASGTIKPDLAAPGVNILCPTTGQSYTTITGTGAAAAHMAGITALMLEWCIIDGNYPDIDTVGIKKFLIRGAKRNPNISYPNRDWGYGIVEIYNVFDVIRADFTSR